MSLFGLSVEQLLVISLVVIGLIALGRSLRTPNRCERCGRRLVYRTYAVPRSRRQIRRFRACPLYMGSLPDPTGRSQCPPPIIPQLLVRP